VQVLLQGVPEGFLVRRALQVPQVRQGLQFPHVRQGLQFLQGLVGSCAWRCVNYQQFVGIESYLLIGEEGLLVVNQVRQTPLLLQL
jgi:hypothetical protein